MIEKATSILTNTDIDNQIQVEELPTHPGRQIADIPRPDQVGSIRDMGGRSLASLRRFRPATMMQLISLPPPLSG